MQLKVIIDLFTRSFYESHEPNREPTTVKPSLMKISICFFSFGSWKNVKISITHIKGAKPLRLLSMSENLSLFLFLVLFPTTNDYLKALNLKTFKTYLQLLQSFFVTTFTEEATLFLHCVRSSRCKDEISSCYVSAADIVFKSRCGCFDDF